MSLPKEIIPLTQELLLAEYLKKLGRVAIAFSGGCDSSLLAAFATRTLSAENVLLVHISTPMTFERENLFARQFAAELGVVYRELDIDALRSPDVVKNDKWRCYHCKKLIFTAILELAHKEGFPVLLDGANADDKDDWRPGAKAADELGVLHPFTECGFGKRLIRLLSRRMGLSTWSMPAAACLASRIPTGTPLTRALLDRCGRAETILAGLGFPGCRVRALDADHASLEFRGPYLHRALRLQNRIQTALADSGFAEITINPEGYRQGSMNKLNQN